MADLLLCWENANPFLDVLIQNPEIRRQISRVLRCRDEGSALTTCSEGPFGMACLPRDFWRPECRGRLNRYRSLLFLLSLQGRIVGPSWGVGLAVSGSEQPIFLGAWMGLHEPLEKSPANFASILYCEYLYCYVFALCLANFSSYISVSG